MQLRWTGDAASDLEHITEYLFEIAPKRAAELVRAIYDAPAELIKFPNRGRPGKKDGTRAGPFLAALYHRDTLSSDVIHVVRILHGAQKWP